MGDGKAKRETEVKLVVGSPAQARRLLYRAGFRVSRRRRREDNLVFDTPSRTMQRRGLLLRLRRSGGESILTYKGPAEGGVYKSRRELETVVGDPVVLERLLRELGYQVSFRYEKVRTEFLCTLRGGTANLDETPIGTFLELEGEPRWIDSIAAKLGFSKESYIIDSYGSLYRSSLPAGSSHAREMVFPRRKRSLRLSPPRMGVGAPPSTPLG
ncbi:MAG: class IV adenylate cyclase [Bryobacteraceae bacterium]